MKKYQRRIDVTNSGIKYQGYTKDGFYFKETTSMWCWKQESKGIIHEAKSIEILKKIKDKEFIGKGNYDHSKTQDYQKFEGGKPGGFVTVDVKELGGFTGKDKARINVPDISKITITTEGEYIKHIDELKSTTTVENPKENNETDEQAIERIAARFSILDEMAEAVNEGKVRAMIVSGPPGRGK